MRKILLAAALAASMASTSAVMAQSNSTIRIGLQDDIGTLDPARSSQVVDRIVFSSLCNSLVDIGPDLKIVPMLATSWSMSADNKTLTFKLRHGVKFHDDEPFNAAAVKANLDRARSMPASNRKSELASIDHVDVVDEFTVAIVLKAPDAALLATLTDRAGMMLAPKTLDRRRRRFHASGLLGPVQVRRARAERPRRAARNSRATGTPINTRSRK